MELNKKKLAIIVSHPIQYYSGLFQTLSKAIDLKVFYGFNPTEEMQGASGFNRAFKWDIDLLKGYEYEFLDNVSKVPSSSHYKGCDTPDLGVRLSEFGATHVVTFGWHLKTFRQALNYCNKKKIPISVRGDSQLNPHQPIWKQMIKKVYYPYFLKKYDAFLSVGKRNRAYLKHYCVSDDKIIFSPHAIDQDFWSVEKKQSTKKFRFIWVAKFISKKRPLDAIRAFKSLLAKEPSLEDLVELQMVGSGPLFDQAIKEASETKQINFPGFKNQTELKAEYAKADCLLLTSDYGETWGLVVNEAFAAGVTAIVSDACGCSEDLIHQETGLCYSLGNIKSLSIAMKQMIDLKDKNPNSYFEGISNMNKVYSYNTNIESFKMFLKL